MPPSRAGTSTVPRGEVDRDEVALGDAERVGVGADSSTHASGAAACSSGARPVLVRVWKW